METTPGSRFRAELIGHRAIYLSGAGVTNASFSLPDLGITTMIDVLEDARRITGVCTWCCILCRRCGR